MSRSRLISSIVVLVLFGWTAAQKWPCKSITGIMGFRPAPASM